MTTDRSRQLEVEIRAARARAEPLHRQIGDHLAACETCRRADSLKGSPQPFCPAGDRLLGELSHCRYDLHMAATQLMRLQGRFDPLPIEQARRRPERRVGTAPRKGREPWTTNPRHSIGNR